MTSTVNPSPTNKWQPVLGFEVHVELATKSKMFCACPADHFAAPPNSQTCPVCLGLPGALPVPNAKAIEWCIKLGLALNCKVNLTSKFDRKNYFYPDLPKGYQISQYDEPFCHSGWIKLASGKKIGITRVHMEEDTGKLQHAELEGHNVSLVDLNRSGVPLVEIVTNPDFDDLDQSSEFLKEIQLIVRALKISSADMEKGSMRLEANVSVKRSGQKDLPKYKIEIKNVNSFRFIKKAIEFEVERQTQLLEQGKIPVQETRGFKESTGETVSQRSKEDAHDYRYFPEPDIPPFKFDSQQLKLWKAGLPVLPAQSRQELVQLGVSLANAATLVASPVRFTRYQQLVNEGNDPVATAKLVVNAAEEALPTLSLSQTLAVSDANQIRQIAQKTIEANPKTVSDYKAGKTQAIFALIGQMKRQLGDNLDVPLAKAILEELV